MVISVDSLPPFLIFLVTGVKASEFTQEEKTDFILHNFKRMIRLSVHDGNTAIAMNHLLKHKISNTDKRKLIV